MSFFFFFFQAEDGIRDLTVTGVQTCALPIYIFHPVQMDVTSNDGASGVVGRGRQSMRRWGIGEPLAFNADWIEGVINGCLLGGRGSRFFTDRRRELLLVHCHSWNGIARPVPAGWECWAIDAEDVDIIVHIPDCCLSTGRIVKQIIWMSVTVKVGRTH